MSEYVECVTKIKDERALIEALIEMGWKKEKIEIHKEAQHLYGYQGDKRAQKANIIIRRGNVGSSSNDMGFLRRADGTYEAIISEYDRRAGGSHAGHTGGYNEKWMEDLTNKYLEKKCTRHALQKGYKVHKKVEGEKIILTVTR